MGLNYHTYYKIMKPLEDGFSESVEMSNYLPFLVFARYSFLTSAQFLNMYRDFGHPSMEKPMKIIEQVRLEDIPKDTRREVQRLVKHCKACQFNQGRPRRFLFLRKAPVIGEFNQVLQIDITSLRHEKLLRVTDVATQFQDGGLINKADAVSIWRTSCRFWINIFTGAPGYTHTDTGTNFHLYVFKT